MSPAAIADYLSQVAPVPFAPEFPFAERVRSSLAEKIPSDALELRVFGVEGPVYRPHRSGFSDEKKRGEFREIEIFDIPDVEGGLGATGWVLHHVYDGAIPTGTGFKGIRFRSGNLQIGGNTLLEELFTEPRFNGWAIGEIHVLDRRIVPNARRDDFEQNAHYSNLMNQLAPIARSISKRCRTSSKRRQLLRDFELQEHGVRERVQILRQGGLRQHAKKIQAGQIEQALDKMSRLTAAAELQDESEGLIARTAKLREKAGKALQQAPQSPLELLPPHKRSMYGQMIELIYDCSTNRSAAKSLVDRILTKITSDPAEPTPAKKTTAIGKKPAATARSTTRGQEKKRPKRRGTR